LQTLPQYPLTASSTIYMGQYFSQEMGAYKQQGIAHSAQLSG